MKKLNEKEWKAFPIDAEYCITERGNVPTGALVDNPSLKEGKNPRIRVTSQNNGINGFTETSDDENYRAYSNFVSMSFLGNAFYHPYTASLDMKVHCLQYTDTELNPDLGLFTVTMAARIASGTNYGNQLSSKDLATKQIMLPVDDKGKPDYDYMAQYSSKLRSTLLKRYENYISEQISNLEYREVPQLEDKKWRALAAFGKHGFLKIATTSSSIDSDHVIEGENKKVPYVTRKGSGNGIAHFVSSDNLSYGSDSAGCITVGLDTQTAYWQPYVFITGQNIQVITGKNLSFYLAQFVIPLLRKQMMAKFNWGGNGATLRRMKELKIMLPVDDAGNPDYNYMEQYSKNMLLRKYHQYLEYLTYPQS